MSKANPTKPMTKGFYAMPKAQASTSNIFEVLGKNPKPSLPNNLPSAYQTKESKQLIQILEADHESTTGDFDLQKIFQKDKFFISNDLSKTCKFYEFILVDTKFVQISHIKNPEGTDIAYSKCKILQIIFEKDWEQSPFTYKRFSQNFVPQTFYYLDYKNVWFYMFLVKPSSHSWFFNWGDKIKTAFPNWFQEW